MAAYKFAFLLSQIKIALSLKITGTTRFSSNFQELNSHAIYFILNVSLKNLENDIF